MTNETITSYKGFDKNFKCRGFQFEVGKSYSVSGAIKVCENGFHGCTNPLDVWGYYTPGISRFAVIEQSGQTSHHEEDSKIASAEITIKVELTLPEFIKRGVDYLLAQVDWNNAKETNTGYRSAATNTGDQSAATNTGKDGVALASGYEGRVSGTDGCALFLVERNYNYVIVAAWAGIVGRGGIKPETFYMLKDGKPVEWIDED